MEFSKNSHLNGEGHKYDEQSILKAVAALSVEQRRCIELFFYQDQSYQQIAEKTGYELKKVKSYIQNGKRNLRIYLEKYEG